MSVAVILCLGVSRLLLSSLFTSATARRSISLPIVCFGNAGLQRCGYHGVLGAARRSRAAVLSSRSRACTPPCSRVNTSLDGAVSFRLGRGSRVPLRRGKSGCAVLSVPLQAAARSFSRQRVSPCCCSCLHMWCSSMQGVSFDKRSFFSSLILCACCMEL